MEDVDRGAREKLIDINVVLIYKVSKKQIKNNLKASIPLLVGRQKPVETFFT